MSQSRTTGGPNGHDGDVEGAAALVAATTDDIPASAHEPVTPPAPSPSHAGLLLAFGASFAALLISPALLSGPLPFYPLLKIGDVTDLITPVVLLPLYWLLLRASGGAITTRSAVLFLGLAAIWASGHGMHLGANAIGHLLAEQDGDAYRLTHFLDEHLSHYLWHGAMIGFVALMLAGPPAGGAASARVRRGALLAWPLALCNCKSPIGRG